MPKLLKEILKKIIDTKDIFIQEKKSNNENNKLILGKYMMKSINNFNASISKGLFSLSSSLATNPIINLECFRTEKEVFK